MAKPVRHGTGWRIRPLDEHGKRFSEVYSTYEDASFALNRHCTRVQEIRRGLRAATPPSKTFDELCDYYLANHSSQKRNQGVDASQIKVHLRPFFRSYKLQDVGQYIGEYKTSRAHLSKKTVHHHLTLLISMLRVAHFEKKWLAELPRVKKPKIKLLEKDYNYLRTDEEIRRFLTAARAEDDKTAYYLYTTAIYTGLREGELAGLRWSDVDFERRQIKTSRSYDGPTKSDETRFVPVVTALLPLLQEWRLQCRGSIVFPNQYGTMLGKSARLFQEVFKRVLERAGFPKITKNDKLRGYIVFHDLRHTFASHYMMRGGDIFRLQRMLGHADIAMTQRYSHLAPHVFAADYDRFGSHEPGAHVSATVHRLDVGLGMTQASGS